MQVSLYRYDPDQDVKPHMQHTSVEVPEGSAWSSTCWKC